jgi:hypothetical protein
MEHLLTETFAFMFREHGLSYFNPSETSNSNNKNRTVPMDKGAIDRCRVILFNVPDSTRSIEVMTMVSQISCRVDSGPIFEAESEIPKENHL